MTDSNRRLLLAERPSGMVDERTVRVEQGDVPEPGAGEALARVRFLSIDPTIRTAPASRRSCRATASATPRVTSCSG
jgi:NADPH-dependent curcumin reductase CurA